MLDPSPVVPPIPPPPPTGPILPFSEGGFGAYSKNPKEIGATVARWLKKPELLLKMKASALQAARPKASYQIAREIADMLFPENGEGVFDDSEDDSDDEDDEGFGMGPMGAGGVRAMNAAVGGGGDLEEGAEVGTWAAEKDSVSERTKVLA